MAVESQSGLRMTALMRLVTQAWPSCTLAGGCSELVWLGVIQDTAGSWPLGGGEEGLDRLHVSYLVVRLDVGEERQRIPDARRLVALGPGRAGGGVVLA